MYARIIRRWFVTRERGQSVVKQEKGGAVSKLKRKEDRVVDF